MTKNRYALDVIERIFWTAVQASLATAIVYVQGSDGLWIPVYAAILALVKGIVAQRFGDSKSAQLPIWVEQAVTDVSVKVTEKVVESVKDSAKTGSAKPVANKKRTQAPK